MKGLKKVMLTWATIIVFLLLLFVVYNRMEPHKHTEEAMPASTELHPIVEEKKKDLLAAAAKEDIDLVITEDVRTADSQDELYEQGRTTGGDIVTNAKGGQSYHNYGLAFDYALKKNNGDIIWDIHYDGNENGKSDWFEVADLAKELGFEWGGDWEIRDYPHLQMTFGRSIEQLQKGSLPDENGG